MYSNFCRSVQMWTTDEEKENVKKKVKRNFGVEHGFISCCSSSRDQEEKIVDEF